MTVAHTTVLSLLGKEVSFSVLLPEHQKVFHPDGIHVTGDVEAVVIHLSGNHQILVCEEFYQLSRIDLKI